MNKLLIMSLLSQCHYGYNPEYENLSEEEKAYMDYVDECLNETDERFSTACTKAMLFILEASSKMGTEEELTSDEALLQKEIILNGFSQEDKDRIESFMYACIQTMGIYSEERVQERKHAKDKSLIKKREIENNFKGQ